MKLKVTLILISTLLFFYSNSQTCTNLGSGLGDVPNTGVGDLEYFNNQLYGCGIFQNTPLINDINSIARMNGSEWESLGGNITQLGVFCGVHDMEPMGDSMAIGGVFDSVGGVFTEAVMFYDGMNFHPFVSNSQNIFVPWYVKKLKYINDTLFCAGNFKVGPGLSITQNAVAYLNDLNEWVMLGFNSLPSWIHDFEIYQNTYFTATNDGLYYLNSSSFWEQIGTAMTLTDLEIYHDTLFAFGYGIVGSNGPFWYTGDKVNFHHTVSPNIIEHGEFFNDSNKLIGIAKQLESDLLHVYKWTGTDFVEWYQLQVPNTSTVPFRINDYLEVGDTAYLSGDWTINGTYNVAKCDYSLFAETTNEEPILINLYPNPTTNNLKIEIPNWSNEQLKFIVLNLLGETMKQGIIYTSVQEIPISELPSGVYILKIEGCLKEQKFVIE